MLRIISLLPLTVLLAGCKTQLPDSPQKIITSYKFVSLQPGAGNGDYWLIRDSVLTIQATLHEASLWLRYLRLPIEIKPL